MESPYVLKMSEHLAEFIRYKRNISDLSQVELAKMAKVARSHICNIESRGANITIGMAGRIFQALSTNFMDFGVFLEQKEKEKLS